MVKTPSFFQGKPSKPLRIWSCGQRFYPFLILFVMKRMVGHKAQVTFGTSRNPGRVGRIHCSVHVRIMWATDGVKVGSFEWLWVILTDAIIREHTCHHDVSFFGKLVAFLQLSTPWILESLVHSDSGQQVAWAQVLGRQLLPIQLHRSQNSATKVFPPQRLDLFGGRR